MLNIVTMYCIVWCIALHVKDKIIVFANQHQTFHGLKFAPIMSLAMSRRIYLDAHATTPVDPAVVAAMLPFMNGLYGNPASEQHSSGREAALAVATARGRVAALIGAESEEIVFTGGATESNNLAIQGSVLIERAASCRVVTTACEHSSVLDPLHALSRHGLETEMLPVDQGGRVDPQALKEALRTKTTLVSLMAANNEVGTVHPISTLAVLTRDQNVLFHCDAAQAVGHIPVDVKLWSVDFLSLSAHKFYGPKGMGALFVRGGVAGSSLRPILHGGGQEDGLRAGTLNVPGIVGLGEACRLAAMRMQDDGRRVASLRDRLQAHLLTRIDGASVNGDQEARLPHNLNISLPGVDGRALARALAGIAISTGAACTAAQDKPSHVLLAMGLSPQRARGTLRFGLTRHTTAAEVDEAADAVVSAAIRLRDGGAGPPAA